MTPVPRGRRAPGALAIDQRGSGSLQNLVLVCALVLAGIAGVKLLSTAASSRSDCAGEQVAAMGGAVPCNDNQPVGAGDPPPPPEAPGASDGDGDSDDDGDEPEAFDPKKELIALALDILGVTDAVKCFTEGDILACAFTVLSLNPFKAIAVAAKLAANAKRIARVVGAFKKAKKAEDEARAAEKVADAGKQCRNGVCDAPGKCFVAGTPVHTETGWVPIEQLQVGDLVLSRDEQTGQEAYRPIAQLFITPDKPVLALTLEDSMGALETVEATPPHPFQVEGRGWVAAGDLQPDDLIVSAGGGRLRVAGTTGILRRTTVYNFEVEEFHTYFVGLGAAWVHNRYSPFKNAREALDAAKKLGFDRRIPAQKAPFNSHGQTVFSDGKNFITPDVDGHIGGVWKMFDRKGRRIGTFDENLNRIGP